MLRTINSKKIVQLYPKKAAVIDFDLQNYSVSNDDTGLIGF